MPDRTGGEMETYYEFKQFTDVLRIRAGDIIRIKADGNEKLIYWRPLTRDGKEIDPLRGLYRKWEREITEEIFTRLLEGGALEAMGEGEYRVTDRGREGNHVDSL
jgi:hypothetical protein